MYLCYKYSCRYHQDLGKLRLASNCWQTFLNTRSCIEINMTNLLSYIYIYSGGYKKNFSAFYKEILVFSKYLAYTILSTKKEGQNFRCN